MLDLMVYSMTIDQRMQELRFGAGRRAGQDQDVTRPVRPGVHRRPTDWWAPRIARLPAGAAVTFPSS